MNDRNEWDPVHTLFRTLSKKWAASVLLSLFPRPLRFAEIQREMDCTNPKTLTNTLKLLEEEGLVHREVVAGRPPGVRYDLTASGRVLTERIYPLWKWASDRAG
ncbi:transcriptional regulator, HxlR family [Prauserella halophila]|nr:transcriptional regulator, HxlR family [Prauserella halophila]